MVGGRIFKFSPPSGLVVVLDSHFIDTRSFHVLDSEAPKRTRCMVKVHNGMARLRIELRILDTRNIVMVTELGNKRRVASAESSRRGAVSLTVRNTNPTVVENAVHERGAVDDVGRQVEENRRERHGRGLEVEVDRTGGGGVL